MFDNIVFKHIYTVAYHSIHTFTILCCYVPPDIAL